MKEILQIILFLLLEDYIIKKTNNWYKGRVSENGYLDYILKINNQQKALERID
jgi:hypothetical protein